MHQRVPIKQLFTNVVAGNATRELERTELIVEQFWIHLTLKIQQINCLVLDVLKLRFTYLEGFQSTWP